MSYHVIRKFGIAVNSRRHDIDFRLQTHLRRPCLKTKQLVGNLNKILNRR